MCRNNYANNDVICTKMIFDVTPGPTQQCNVVDVDNVMEIVTLFLPEEFFNILVSETNLYAQQYFERVGVLQQHSRATAWFPVTKDEIKTFIGLTLLTGLVDKKGDIATYWTKDKTLATPFFNATMSRNRYQLLSRFLHCSDNNSRPANCTDKLYKIRPVYDLLKRTWKDMYNLNEHIAIDEGLLKWRGRLSFRVYNKNKPIKYGIKSYILCDSDNSYCWFS